MYTYIYIHACTFICNLSAEFFSIFTENFPSFLDLGYVPDQTQPASAAIQHSQYVPETESVPHIHPGVHSEYSSSTPVQPGGHTTNSQQDEEQPFSPPELIPSVGTTGDVMATGPLRQVSMDSCSNLVIDEQGSNVGGAFPSSTPTPSSGYTLPGPGEEQRLGGVPTATPATDGQGFTPFVLATQTLEDTPLSSHAPSNGQPLHSQQEEVNVHRAAEEKDEHKEAESAKGGESSNSATQNKGKTLKPRRHNYNAYSSDDDDDVFLPNPPPKSQADRCTIAMETDEDNKDTIAKEMEPSPPQQHDSKEDEDDSDKEDTLMIDDRPDGVEGNGESGDRDNALNDSKVLDATVATTTDTEGDTTATEDELDVVTVSNSRNVPQNENDEEEDRPTNAISSPPPLTNKKPSKPNQVVCVCVCVYFYN